ncbi:MAG: hypothetical protein AB8H79_25435 [Myxococcota bacterium]
MIAPGWDGSALLWLLPWIVAPAVALVWRTRPTVGHGLRRWGLWVLVVCTVIQLCGHFMNEPMQSLAHWAFPPPDPPPPVPVGYIVPDSAAGVVWLGVHTIGVLGRFVGVLLIVLGFGRLVRVRVAEMGEESTDL